MRLFRSHKTAADTQENLYDLQDDMIRKENLGRPA